MEITVAISVSLIAIIGVGLTILTLPGIWIAIAAAVLAQWWSIERTPAQGDELFNWWTIGACIALGVLGELVEAFASAYGATKAGGTRRGAIGSVIGGILGALGGTFIIPIPIVGTVLGAALGAGAGALLAERHNARKTWGESTKIGAGAAAGRLVATLAKGAIAAVVAGVLIVGVWNP